MKFQDSMRKGIKVAPFRPGKTAKDHASGAHQRNRDNVRERRDWQNDSKSEKFPAHTCNGKKNRQYTNS